MANYIGIGRSNYFKVKDSERLKRIIGYYDLYISKEDENGPYCLLSRSEDGDIGGYYFPDEKEFRELVELGLVKETNDPEDIQLPPFLQVIAPLLEDDEVFIWMHAGNEKLRYITAYAVAVNNKGETTQVELYDIYEKAKKLGKNITAAEY